MRKFIVFCVVFMLSVPCLLQAQSNDKTWYVEAGPYIGIPVGTFHLSHAFGFGADARVARDFGNNFSGGGRITYAYFFGKNIYGTKVLGLSMAGIYANLQYTYEEKYIAGVDLGLGFSAAGGFFTTGFARTGYAGYQWQQGDHLLTIAAYFNRTTIATYNLGIKGWLRF